MKYYDKLKEFLDDEFSDYSYFKYEIDFDEEYAGHEYYTVNIKTTDDRKKTLSFKLNELNILIDMGDDNWQETRNYGYKVKYFWMTLLSWEI